ncbi:MAG: arginine--tRNA ligase [Deltaproteobacteria bacterium]|nr:arginine--tRNA ligase [Deltaproteobacteria bacterium]PWB60801.1 MAG: arginine--tRNA ligase [Deltaproteobacteria bacterium]
MDVRKITESLLLSGIKRKLAEWGTDLEIPVSVEIPRQEEHGDFSTNAAMQLARRVGKKPREVAGELVEAIRQEDEDGWIASLSVAGPGFINIVLSDDAWREVVATALRKGNRFGASDQAKGENVLLEFVSANPTGPLHVGHGRGAAVGDALARILSFEGYEVATEYYVNDVGNQMDNLGRSLFARYLQECGRDAQLPEDGYRGEYLAALAREFREEAGDRYMTASVDEALPVFRKVACDRILEGIRKDLEEFRVVFGNWFREEKLHRDGDVKDSIEALRGREMLYESDGAIFFKSEAHGDEKDRVLVRSDGRTTYFASDVAYHRHKFRRGYARMIDIWGADHHGYAPRLLAALRGLGEEESRLEVLLVQFVTLIRDGKAVQMSTRSGEFTTLREVLEEVGTDAARFFYLLRSHHTHLDFDLTLAKTRSAENPVYYIQYVHARICSIFREAAARETPLSDPPPLSSLSLPDELALMKKVARFPDVVSEAARLREPHRIPFYLIELAREFHAFYQNHRFLGETPERTQGRLALARAVMIVVRTGFSLIGVTAPERM